MVMYLDSAIIVKLLVRENTTATWFENNLNRARFETSELALTEVCAALLFKERKDELFRQERIGATEKFLSMVEERNYCAPPLNRQVHRAGAQHSTGVSSANSVADPECVARGDL